MKVYKRDIIYIGRFTTYINEIPSLVYRNPKALEEGGTLIYFVTKEFFESGAIKQDLHKLNFARFQDLKDIKGLLYMRNHKDFDPHFDCTFYPEFATIFDPWLSPIGDRDVPSIHRFYYSNYEFAHERQQSFKRFHKYHLHKRTEEETTISYNDYANVFSFADQDLITKSNIELGDTVMLDSPYDLYKENPLPLYKVIRITKEHHGNQIYRQRYGILRIDKIGRINQPRTAMREVQQEELIKIIKEE